MSFSENKGLWLSVSAAIVAVVALVWLLLSGGPKTLVILFPESGDLKREDPVLWHDYVVGRVTKIEPLVDNQVGVTIRLNEEYATRITRGTRFTLKRAALFGIVGDNAVEVETPSEAGLPYLDGEKIQGFTPPRPTVVEQGKGVVLNYWEELQKQASNLMAEYERSPYRKDIEDALAQLKALAEKGMGVAKEEWDAFTQSHQKEFDSIVKKIEDARDWMRKQGDEAGARRLQQEIDKIKKK